MPHSFIKSLSATALIWLLLLSITTHAFGPLPASTSPEIVSRYSTTQSEFAAKYGELRTRVSSITERAIVRSERAVTRAYQLVSNAKTEQARSVAERSLARSIKALEKRYIKAQKIFLAAIAAPNV